MREREKNHKFISSFAILLALELIFAFFFSGICCMDSLASPSRPEARDLGVQGYINGSDGINHITDHTPILNYTYYNADGDQQYQRNISVYLISTTWLLLYYDNSTVLVPSGTNVTLEYPYTYTPLDDGNSYVLRVVCNDTSGEWSEIATMGFTMHYPRPPALWSPYNGDVNVPLLVHLNWDIFPSWNSSQPNIYYWYVNKSDSIEVIINGTTSAHFAIFTAEQWTTYYWHVTKFDGYEWTNSTYYHFTTSDAPISTVHSIFPYFRNSPLNITITASDICSGVKNVTLYYIYSKNNATWTNLTKVITESNSTLHHYFNFPDGEGYYEFYSMAIDNIGNEENKSLICNASCYYDISKPCVIFNVLGDINVSVNASVSVTFNETMNKSSVENAFSMTHGPESVSGNFAWSEDGKTVTFVPLNPLLYNASYNVSISTDARDLSGNNLSTAHLWGFVTEVLKTESNNSLNLYWFLIIFILTIVLIFYIILSNRESKKINQTNNLDTKKEKEDEK